MCSWCVKERGWRRAEEERALCVCVLVCVCMCMCVCVYVSERVRDGSCVGGKGRCCVLARRWERCGGGMMRRSMSPALWCGTLSVRGSAVRCNMRMVRRERRPGVGLNRSRQGRREEEERGRT